MPQTVRLRRLALALAVTVIPAASQPRDLKLNRAEYEERVQGAWTAQMLATLMGFPFEHRVASTQWIDRLPKPYTEAPVDDDYYYELVALRAFEEYGINMTLDQLGAQWKRNNAGSWGSSEQTRLLLARGVPGSEAGHPRYNRLWFSIGPQFSGDIYGMLAPGDVNLAGKLARTYGRINGWAEGVDGAVFVAGMVSAAFRETDPKAVVREAARLIHPSSPYRQCLDLVIAAAEAGRTPEEVFQAVEDRWHIEYPATNNAVANGGIVAASVWFGGGDFLKTVNLALRAADFTDADCNAANAAAVVGAMHGMKALPAAVVAQLGGRIAGAEMGGVKLTPPVEERVPDIARRIAAVGTQLVAANGGRGTPEGVVVPWRPAATQPADLFRLGELTRWWNADWTLERAGFGGAGGGLRGLRGMTYLDGDVLATYPRDEVRGVLLRRSARLGGNPRLSFEVAADPGRAWQLEVYVANTSVLSRLVEGRATREFERVEVDLSAFAGQEVQIRLYQRVLVGPRTAGNAYWRNPRIE